MPYIEKNRAELDRLAEIAASEAFSDGQMNYLITRIVNIHYGLKDANYEQIQKATGLLECVKLELYRRKAAPYEDRKIAQNGDVPEYEEN